MARDPQTEAAIAAIAARARQSRKPTPRWMWIAAAVVGALCAAGFVIFMASPGEPPAHPLARTSDTGSGLGTGLVIGAVVGVVIGFTIARQRGDHSSRNNP